MPVLALDGLPYIPSVIGYANDRAMVGAPARAHFFVSPNEVLFSPARHLGGAPVRLGEDLHEPESLVACLLGQAVLAAEVAARGAIDGVALSRAAWASPEARRALAAAAQRAGMNLVRTEVSTTLAALAHLVDHGPTGLAVFVDVGGWKIEATVLMLEPGAVRALGRSVDATIGANWLDGRLVKALAHQVAGEDERKLLKDRLCYAMLREQCESLRIQLSAQSRVNVSLPFLMPLLGTNQPPNWRLERPFLDMLAQPLVEAVQVVCGEALEHARLQPNQINEVFVLGGLAHMPVVREAVGGFFGRQASSRGDLDGLVARGAALIAAASMGQTRLRLVDDLDDHGVSIAAAGWGQLIPPSLTPTPEVLPVPPPSSVTPGPELYPYAHDLPHVDRPLHPPTHAPHPSAHDLPRADKPVHPPALPTRATHPSAHDLPHADKPAHPPAPHAHAPAPPPPVAPAHVPATATTTEPAQPETHHATAGPESGQPTPPAHPKGHEQPLAAEGRLRNPRDPAELAAFPLDGPLQLTPPLSVPVLLLAIGRRRSFSGHLRFKWGNHEASIAIVRGGAAGTSLEMEQLRRAFEWPEGQYRLTGEAPPARLLNMRQSMVGVVAHGIRSCLRVMDVRQVLDVLDPHLHEAPRLLQSRAALIPLLGLSPRELRFVEHVLDGAISAEEILRRGGIGRETAVHLMFVLQLFRALEWLSVQDRPGESAADQLRLRAHKLEKADHFEALGVHWSVARMELDRALQRIEEEMQPGGSASQLDAEAATRILARARQAHAAVARAGDRHAYLLAIHPDIDFESIESVAEDQKQWYSYRGAAAATQESARLKDELLELSRLQHLPPGKPQR